MVDRNATRLRLLFGILVVTVALAMLPVDSVSTSDPAIVAAELPTGNRARSGSAGLQGESETLSRASADLFAPRDWGVDAPVPRPAIYSSLPPPVTSAIAKVEPPSAPVISLPYRFAGRFINDGDVTIYLLRGDEVAIAKQGVVLDGLWRVEKVEPTQIDFVHTGTGKLFLLPVPESDG